MLGCRRFQQSQQSTFILLIKGPLGTLVPSVNPHPQKTLLSPGLMLLFCDPTEPCSAKQQEELSAPVGETPSCLFSAEESTPSLRCREAPLLSSGIGSIGKTHLQKPPPQCSTPKLQTSNPKPQTGTLKQSHRMGLAVLTGLWEGSPLGKRILVAWQIC